MILTKQDLREYILTDRSRYTALKETLIFKLKTDIKALFRAEHETYYALKYLKNLRLYEFYLNNSHKNVFFRLLSKFYSLKHKRLSNKYKIYITPNTVGKGLYIPHFAGGINCNCISMGDYCTISTGVVIGNKGGQENRPIIGNNVELCVGCKVIGKVILANNVIVAPNSVVIKNVPANAIVSGVPAIIINK